MAQRQDLNPISHEEQMQRLALLKSEMNAIIETARKAHDEAMKEVDEAAKSMISEKRLAAAAKMSKAKAPLLDALIIHDQLTRMETCLLAKKAFDDAATAYDIAIASTLIDSETPAANEKIALDNARRKYEQAQSEVAHIPMTLSDAVTLNPPHAHTKLLKEIKRNPYHPDNIVSEAQRPKRTVGMPLPVSKPNQNIFNVEKPPAVFLVVARSYQLRQLEMINASTPPIHVFTPELVRPDQISEILSNPKYYQSTTYRDSPALSLNTTFKVLRFLVRVDGVLVLGAEGEASKSIPAHCKLDSLVPVGKLPTEAAKCITGGSVYFNDQNVIVMLDHQSGDFHPSFQSLQFALRAFSQNALPMAEVIYLKEIDAHTGKPKQLYELEREHILSILKDMQRAELSAYIDSFGPRSTSVASAASESKRIIAIALIGSLSTDKYPSFDEKQCALIKSDHELNKYATECHRLCELSQKQLSLKYT